MGKDKTVSRRDFVRETSQASAGLLLGGLIFGRKGSRIRGANDRVNVAFIGFSNRAERMLAPCLAEHARELNFGVTGVSDIWKPRREAGSAFLEKLFGYPVPAARNNDELYGRGGIDAVIVSTPGFQHAPQAAEAAGHGKDIYVETPFAETMPENRLAFDAVQRAGVVVQTGLQRRSAPGYRASYEYFRSVKTDGPGECEMYWYANPRAGWRRPGRVAACREEETDWSRFRGNRPYEEFDPHKYVEYRLYRAYSSGIPGEWLSHQTDLVHWFTGYRRPRSVTAEGGILRWPDGRTNCDTLKATAHYGPDDDPAKGFRAVFSAGLTDAPANTEALFRRNGETWHAAAGRIVLPDGTRIPVVKPGSANTAAAYAAAAAGNDPAASLHMRNWMECIRRRSATNAPATAGYDQSTACIMINAALRTGRPAVYDAQRREVTAGGEVFEY